MYLKAPKESPTVKTPLTCWQKHSRKIFYFILILSLIVMVVDCLIQMDWLPPFYLVTNACILFRVFGVNWFSWLLHILLPIVAIVLILINDYPKVDDPSAFWIPGLIAFLMVLGFHMMVFRHGRTMRERLLRVGLHSTIGIVFIVIYFWATGTWRMKYMNVLTMIYMLLFLIMFLTPQFLMCSQEVVVAYQGRSRTRHQSKSKTSCPCDTPPPTRSRPPRRSRTPPRSWMPNSGSRNSPSLCPCSSNDVSRGRSRMRVQSCSPTGHDTSQLRSRSRLAIQCSASRRSNKKDLKSNPSHIRGECSCDSHMRRKSVTVANRRESRSPVRSLRLSLSETNLHNRPRKKMPNCKKNSCTFKPSKTRRGKRKSTC